MTTNDGARIALVCGKDLEADGAEVAGRAFEVECKFFGDHGAQLGDVGGRHQLGLVDEVVAAQEGDDGDFDGFAGAIPLLAHVGNGLDVGRGRDLEELGDVRDGGFARGVDELGHAVAGRLHLGDGESCEVAFSRFAA